MMFKAHLQQLKNVTYLLNPVPHQGNQARETGMRKQLTFLDLTFNFQGGGSWITYTGLL